MSRSLVGSSRTSRFDGFAKSRASNNRLRSPPERNLTRAARSLRSEQEILEIADDVTRLAVDRDRVVFADVLLNGLVLIQRRFQLVEVRDFQPSAVPDRPCLGAAARRATAGSRLFFPTHWHR